MQNELSVSLNLDTRNYEKDIQEALNIFNGFQKALSDPKLKFTDFQISELSKIFDRFEDLALSKIKQVNDQLNKLTEQKRSIQIEMEQKGINETYQKILDQVAARKAQLEAEGRTGGASYKLADEPAKAYYEKNVKPFEDQMAAIDEKIAKFQNDYGDLIQYLTNNPLEVDYYNPEFSKFNVEIDNVKNGFTRTGQEVKKAKKEVDLFAALKGKLSIFGRIFSQIKNTIANALNPLNNFKKMWSEIIMSDTSRFGATFRNIGNNIMEYLTPVFETLANVILRCIAYFNQFLKSISNGQIDLFKLSAKSAKEMQGSVSKTKQMLAGFDEINDIGSKDGGGAGGTGKEFVSPFSEEEVMKNSQGAWDKITDAVGNARKGLQDYQDDIAKVMSLDFTAYYDKWDLFVRGISTLWQGLVDIVAGVWDTIEGLIGIFIDIIKGDWDNLGKHFQQFCTGLWEIVKGAFEIMLAGVETLIGAIKAILQYVWDWIKEHVVDPIWNGIVKIFTEIGEEAANNWNILKEGFTNLVNGIKNGAADLWKKVTDGFNKMINGIKTGVTNVWNFIKSIPSKIWTGVKTIVNYVIDGVNKLIQGMNKIQWDVPDWVPFIGGQKWGINIPEIPRLEVGTNYVPQDTLAMIHKGEAVVPKEFNSQEFFGTGNDEVVNKLDELIQALENKNMTVNISKQTIGQASVDYQRYENRRLGRRLV